MTAQSATEQRVLMLLATATQALLTSGAWQDVVSAVCADVCQTLDANISAVLAREVVHIQGGTTGFRSVCVEPESAVQLLLIEDVLTTPHEAPGWLERLTNGEYIHASAFELPLPLRSLNADVAIFPIHAEDRFWGVLVVVNRPALPAPESSLPALRALATVIGAAITKQHLASRPPVAVAMPQRVEHATSAGLHTLLAITEDLLAAADLDSALRLAAERVLNRLHLDRCAILLRHEDDLELRYISVNGLPLLAAPPLRAPLSEFEHVYSTQIHTSTQPMVVYGPHYTVENNQLILIGNGQSVFTPIRTVRGLHGVFVNDNARTGRPFDADTQELVTVFCSLLGTIIDRLSADTELRQSEALYRTLVETVPDGIALLDGRGTIKLCNLPFARLMGAELPGTLVGLRAISLMGDADNARFEQVISQQPYGPYAIELDLPRLDDRRLPVEVNFNVLRDPSGERTSYIAVVRDLTQRRQDRERLNAAYNHLRTLNDDVLRSRDRLRALFDALDDAVVLLDTDGWALLGNHAFARLSGIGLDAITNYEWPTIARAIDPAFDGGWISETLQDGQARRREQRISQAHTPPRLLDIHAYPVQGISQPAHQIILRFTDITDRVRLEVQLRENERFATGGRLAATVAHEINTPLQSIQAFLFLLANRDEQHDVYLTFAQQELERIAAIVRQLLDIYRPNERDPIVLDVNALVDRTLMLLDHLLAKSRISVRRMLYSNLAPVRGRANQLTQVLLNLIVNAVQAMPDGGQLTIETSETTQHVLISVRDTGPGITLEDQVLIFQPFFSKKEDGTGLGLAISTQIINEHDGHLSVQSWPDHGSTFTISLPRQPADIDG